MHEQYIDNAQLALSTMYEQYGQQGMIPPHDLTLAGLPYLERWYKRVSTCCISRLRPVLLAMNQG